MLVILFFSFFLIGQGSLAQYTHTITSLAYYDVSKPVRTLVDKTKVQVEPHILYISTYCTSLTYANTAVTS